MLDFKIEKETLDELSDEQMDGIVGGMPFMSYIRNFGHWNRRSCKKKVKRKTVKSCATHGTDKDACSNYDKFCVVEKNA